MAIHVNEEGTLKALTSTTSGYVVESLLSFTSCSTSSDHMPGYTLSLGTGANGFKDYSVIMIIVFLSSGNSKLYYSFVINPNTVMNYGYQPSGRNYVLQHPDGYPNGVGTWESCTTTVKHTALSSETCTIGFGCNSSIYNQAVAGTGNRFYNRRIGILFENSSYSSYNHYVQIFGCRYKSS